MDGNQLLRVSLNSKLQTKRYRYDKPIGHFASIRVRHKFVDTARLTQPIGKWSTLERSA